MSESEANLISSEQSLAQGSSFGGFAIKQVSLVMSESGNFSTTASNLTSSLLVPARLN